MARGAHFHGPGKKHNSPGMMDPRALLSRASTHSQPQKTKHHGDNMAERTRLPLHLGPQSVTAFAGLGIGWPHPGLSDLQTHHDSFWAHGLQELSVCLHLLLPAPRQGRPSGNNAGRTAWLAQSPQLGSKSQASCEPIPGHRSSGRGGSGDSQHRGPRGTCPAPSHPTPPLTPPLPKAFHHLPIAAYHREAWPCSRVGTGIAAWLLGPAPVFPKAASQLFPAQDVYQST